MSSCSNRNPSPPPEILDSDENLVPDRIGTTLYSKRWLYKTLMNMLKAVQEFSAAETNKEDTSDAEEAHGTDQTIMELDTEVEDEACTLWDISANQEVAEFLCECDIADVFLEIIESTKSPRLLEIVIGILGNMSSFNVTCAYIAKNKRLVNAVVMLSGCSDSCTLVQLFRLLTCGVVKESSQQEWFSSFEENPSFLENLKCILENNLCRNVLVGALEFLESLLNYKSSYCSLLCDSSWVLTFVECGNQLLKSGTSEDLDMLFIVLNTLCQETSNVPVYAKSYVNLRPLFHAYISKLGEEEYLPSFSRYTGITNAFSLFGNFLFSGNILKEDVIFDVNAFNVMLSLCRKLKRLIYLQDLRKAEKQNTCEDVGSVTMTQERNGDLTGDGDTSDNWIYLLKESIIHAAKACIPFTTQDSERQILEEILKCS